jgi:magnesium chelatase family protein
LLDRIDIQLEVPRLKAPDIMDKQSSEPSSEMKKRVEAARLVQRKRYQGKRWVCNAELTARELGVVCRVSKEGEELLKMAIQELGFSARAYHKCLKVSRTIADIEGSESIEVRHVSEAIHYRTLDKLSGII